MSSIIVYGILTLASLLGFVASIVLRDRKHLTLGFSAGALVAASLLVLLPEALEHTESLAYGGAIVVAVAIVSCIALVRMSRHDHAVFVGPGAVASHSFFDGLAGGLAGVVLGVAYLPIIASLGVHRFTDGLTVGSLAFRNKLNKKLLVTWLLLTILLPLLGILVAHFISVTEIFIGLVFALLAGVFFYIGVIDILPELRHHHAKFPTFSAIAIGFIVVLTLSFLGGH